VGRAPLPHFMQEFIVAASNGRSLRLVDRRRPGVEFRPEIPAFGRCDPPSGVATWKPK